MSPKESAIDREEAQKKQIKKTKKGNKK